MQRTKAQLPDTTLTNVLSVHAPHGKPVCEFSQVFALTPPESYRHLYKDYQKSISSSASQNATSTVQVKILDKRPQEWYQQYTDLVSELILICNQWLFACLEERQHQLRLQLAMKQYQERIKLANKAVSSDENEETEQQWVQQFKNSVGESLFKSLQTKLTPNVLLNLAKMHTKTLPTDTYPLIQLLEEQYLGATQKTQGFTQAILRMDEIEKSITALWNRDNYKIISPWEAIIESCRKYIESIKVSKEFTGELPDFNTIKQKALQEGINELEQQYGVKFPTRDYNKLFLQQYTCVFYRESLDANSKIVVSIISPNLDPLSLFKKETENTGVKLHEFYLTRQGWQNQNQRSLSDVMTNSFWTPNLMIFPQLGLTGANTINQFYVLLNPKIVTTTKALPIIKFVETYTIRVQWNGYEVGELSYAINLLPGETKKIVISSQSKITKQVNSNRTDSSEQQTRQQSSFDENLQNEFSSTENQTQSDKTQQKEEQSRQERQQRQQELALDEATKAEKDSAETTEAARSDQTTEQHEHTVSTNKSKSSGTNYVVGKKKKKSSTTETFKDTTTKSSATSSQESRQNKQTDSQDTQNKMKAVESQETALSMALNRESVASSEQARESSTKNIQNSIRKVATETSSNNRLTVTSSTSSEFQQESSNLEEVTISNPNIGRTLNFNFFQLRNQYATQVFLEDIKIVVQEDTGITISKDENLQEPRVYELEEFNRILQMSDEVDNYHILLAALIVQHVLRHYMTIEDGKPTANSLLGFDKKHSITQQIIETLQNAALPASGGANYQKQCDELHSILRTIANINFNFQKQPISDKEIQTINAGAFHVDSQIGLKSAVEPFIDHKRLADLQKEHADVEKVYAEVRLTNAKTLFFNQLRNTHTALKVIVKEEEFRGDLLPSGSKNDGSANELDDLANTSMYRSN